MYTKETAQKYRHIDETETIEIVEKFKIIVSDTCKSLNKKIDVLDLGCGCGRYCRSLSNVNMYVGVDLSQDMLNEAKDLCNKVFKHFSLIKEDINTFYLDEKFDLIICFGVINHAVPISNDIINKCYTMLKENGIIIMEINDSSITNISELDIKKNFRKKYAGKFSIDCVEGMGYFSKKRSFILRIEK